MGLQVGERLRAALPQPSAAGRRNPAWIWGHYKRKDDEMPVSEISKQNLEKRTPFTSETARIAAKISHEKGAETRRKNKIINEMVLKIAQGKVTDENIKEELTAYGVAEEDQLNCMAAALSLYKQALGGNVGAFKVFQDCCEKAAPADDGQVQDPNTILAVMKGNYYDSIDCSFASLGSKALNHIYTHYDVRGGRGSTKSSWVSLTVVTLMMLNADVHALVLRKVANTLRSSVYPQYQWAIKKLGVEDLWEAKKSPLALIYKPTGQKIMFLGADDPTKIKSIKTEFGYIGITHFEEKDQFSGRQEIENILQSTMRGGEMFWNFESWNPPRSKDNWANKDSLEERENRIQHKSSYCDLDHQEWLSKAFIDEAESLKKRDEKRYEHEYLGIPVGIGGNVFENIEERTISDAEIRTFDRIYQGVDWGWFPDPYAFIRLHYDKAHETIYLLDELYVNKKSNEETARWIREHGYEDVETICDTSEKKSIADYRYLDVNAKEARKGAGSVEYGMKWLQNRTIVIDRKRTPHAYEEFVNYQYEQNSKGEWISGYPDQNNHLIDATRYALEKAVNKYRNNA
jgi:PBSX family phage terminase large subunit